MKSISSKDFPISEEKQQYVINDIYESFKKYATSRRIFKTMFVSDQTPVDDEKDFVKIGYNQIIDRGFFVRDFGSTYYDYQGLGDLYGRGVALGEMKYIINTILDCHAEIENEIVENDPLRALPVLINDLKIKQCQNIIIVLHPKNNMILRNHPSFKIPTTATQGFLGTFDDAPIYWTTEIPSKIYLVFDNSLGEILIKKELTADISEIQDFERSRLLRQLPDTTLDMLKERVRLTADEVIRFKLAKPKALRVLTI